MSSASPIPDNYPRVTAYAAVDGAIQAIAFYSSVFGMNERMRMQMPGGAIGHAELELGDGLFMLSDEFPDMGVLGPKSVGGTPVRMSIYVDDVDDVFERALAEGATEIRAVGDQFWGDRSGLLEDPWGLVWNVSTRVEDVSDEEIERRTKEFFGGE